MKSEQLLRAMGGIGDDLVEEAGERLRLLPVKQEKEEPMHSKKTRNIRRILLIAAAVTALLVITALAAGIFHTTAAPVEGDGGLSGAWNGHTVTFTDARMYLTFDSDAPRHKVYVRANWLPSEPTSTWTDDDSLGQGYIADEGEGSVLPYSVSTLNSAQLNGVRYTFNGQAEVVLQNEWNGLERTEITVDYTENEHVTFPSANYILLFDPDDNWMIQIAGTSDMATLEKIADNLEIRVGPENTEGLEQGFDIAWFDLGRG